MAEEEAVASVEDQGKKDSGQQQDGPQAEPSVAAEAAGTEKRPFRQARPERTGPSWRAMFALCLLVSMLTSAGSVYVYDHYYAQKIVSVDIKGYIAQQRNLYLAGKLTDEQFRGNIDKLEAVVKSIPKNRVAIMGDAVIRNAKTEKLPD